MINQFRLILAGILLLMMGVSGPEAADFRSALAVGHDGGKGWNLSVTAHDFAAGFPLGARVGLGYSTMDPGDAAEARRIFINDNQGGTIQKHGSVLQFTLDMLYPLTSASEIYLYFGPRYASFTGNYKFIGNNEDFDVTSRLWGIGIGVESDFSISSKFDLVLSAGTNYFFSSVLYGHDTSYSPSGENINPRRDYSYQDADNAVNQPKFELRLIAGISYHLGK